MIANSLNAKNRMNRLSLKIRRSQPLQVNACEIDGYGNYGCQLADALQVALPQLGALNHIADIPAEEFEAACDWFWS